MLPIDILLSSIQINRGVDRIGSRLSLRPVKVGFDPSLSYIQREREKYMYISIFLS